MAESFAMKKSLLLVLVALMLSSCGGPEEGPLGIHVGDKLGVRGWNGEVTAMGKDWIEVKPWGSSRHTGNKRYRADEFKGGIKIDCPHK